MDDALKIRPMSKADGDAIEQCLVRVPILKLYSYLYQTELELDRCNELAEPLAEACISILQNLRTLKSR